MLSSAAEARFIDRRIFHDAWAGEPGERAMGIPIPYDVWPAKLRPVVKGLPDQERTSAAPATDLMVITYTTDETRAMSYVFTGQNEFEQSWRPYGHNFSAIKPRITAGLVGPHKKPTVLAQGVMAYLQLVTVRRTRVLLVKSEMHPARNGKHLPFIDLVRQLVEECTPRLVVTSGTGGAVGSHLNCGDVVVTDTALFHCRQSYSDYPEIPSIKSGGRPAPLASSVDPDVRPIQHANQRMMKLTVPGLLGDAAKLHAHGVAFVTANQEPQIYCKHVPGARAMNVLSADYFSVDDSHDTEGLQELGIIDDMDDAFVALAIEKADTAEKPRWLSIRNASEPQLPYSADEAVTKDTASKIYDSCGYHTSINGAFACWAIAAGL
jgi:hypothetical protein